ncbi:MAG: DUF3347 domain-containing protein [Bacteroidetes bacterium]|nr:DUF3347 domain-containing protein [Bacteroidota bacterium]
MDTKAILLSLPLLAFLPSCNAQIKHARTATVRIDGNCGMCEATIEKAADVKAEAHADWDKDTKQAVIVLDTTRTTLDAVLRRIANAGYDNERYLAPDAAYAGLPACCRYERSRRAPEPEGTPAGHDAHGHRHTAGTEQAANAAPSDQSPQQELNAVFAAYFSMKDALVASDAALARQRGAAFDEAVHSVPMDKLDPKLHTLWMDVMPGLMDPAHLISGTTDLKKQRDAFAQLTTPMKRLAQGFPTGLTIYVDHCPMYNGGSDWLSTDQAIKNPFFGSAMLGCGSVSGTIEP